MLQLSKQYNVVFCSLYGIILTYNSWKGCHFFGPIRYYIIYIFIHETYDRTTYVQHST